MYGFISLFPISMHVTAAQFPAVPWHHNVGQVLRMLGPSSQPPRNHNLTTASATPGTALSARLSSHSLHAEIRIKIYRKTNFQDSRV